MPNIYVTIYLPSINTNQPFLYIGSNWNDDEKYLGSSSNKLFKKESKINPLHFKKIILHQFDKSKISRKSLLKLEEIYLKIHNVRKSKLYFNKVDVIPISSDAARIMSIKIGIENQIKNGIGIFIKNRNEIFRDDFSVGGKNAAKNRKEKGIPQFINVNHSEVGKKSGKTHKKNGTNFYNSEYQKKMSSKGNSKGGKIGGKMIHVNNGVDRTRVYQKNLEQFLLENPTWKTGCLMKKRTSKFCWVSNKKETLRINVLKLEQYILNGWIRGRKFI